MIRTEFGNTHIKGDEQTILKELTILLKNVRETIADSHDTEYADERIEKCLKRSKMTEEELFADMIKTIREAKRRIDSELKDENGNPVEQASPLGALGAILDAILSGGED